jgi:hydroxymethylbilane synthase
LLRIATRASRLAQWQAERVAALLRAAGDECELVLVTTTGDRRRDVPIHTMGGTGVFVREVQAAVLDGRADLAVHSAKDLPAETPDGLMLAAVPERADPRDALVGAPLSALRAGSVVATGSVRRRVQLAAAVPGLQFAELRGNIETRLAKAEQFDAIVVAFAALDRLDLESYATEILAGSVVLPMVAQGALAVEARRSDEAMLDLLTRIDDRAAHACVAAERAFLAGLGGGCEQPLGALATVSPNDAQLTLEAMVADESGALHRTKVHGADPKVIGAAAAHELVSFVPHLRGELTHVRGENGGAPA